MEWTLTALAQKDKVLTGIELDFYIQTVPSELCVLTEVFLVMPVCLKSTTTHHEVVIQLHSASDAPRGVVSKSFDDLSIFPIFSMTLTSQEYYNLVVLHNACKTDVLNYIWSEGMRSYLAANRNRMHHGTYLTKA